MNIIVENDADGGLSHAPSDVQRSALQSANKPGGYGLVYDGILARPGPRRRALPGVGVERVFILADTPWAQQ